MHVKARMTAFSGLLLALSVVCMALGSVIETNTLFLLAAASYFVGIIIREFGMKAGVAFYLADILLGFLVTPNKFYVISFAAMGFYILATEGSCLCQYCHVFRISAGKYSHQFHIRILSDRTFHSASQISIS